MTQQSGSSDNGTNPDPDKALHEKDIESSNVSDGGLREWYAFVGVWLIHFVTLGYIGAFGVYNDFYVRRYLIGHTASQVSWIGSVQLFLVPFLGVLTGPAYDAGYFYHMVAGGSTLFGFSLFLLSCTKPGQFYQVLLSHGFGLGLAIGLVEAPTFTFISHCFIRRRVLALTLTSTATAAGSTVHSIMLNEIINGRLGFHNGVRASAGFCIGLLLVGMLLVKQRPPPVSAKYDLQLLHMFRSFASDGPFVFTTIGVLFVGLGLFFPAFFIQLSAIQNGINPQLAFYLIAILNASGVVGRVGPTFLVPRLGVFNILTTMLWMVTILLFCGPAIKGAAGTIAFTVLYGLFFGTYIGLIVPLVTSITDDDSQLGARYGCAGTLSAVGGLFGSPIGGALLTRKLLWWRGFTYAGLCTAVSNICFLAARFLASQKKGTQWL